MLTGAADFCQLTDARRLAMDMGHGALYGKRRQDKDPVLEHLGLVRRVVAHLSVRLPQRYEREELVQMGTVGLLEALQTYDAERGVDFAGYAVKRIRGAILDELRKLANQPRSATAAMQRHAAAEQALMNTLGRTPTQQEVAAHLGLEHETYQRERSHIQSFQTISSELVTTEVDDVADERESEPEARLGQAQMMDLLANSIEALPERDRLVLSLYYNDELNLKEIGAVIGVTESRVSQILSASVKKLRAVMTG